MQEAQELTDTLEQNLDDRNLGAANVRPEVVEAIGLAVRGLVSGTGNPNRGIGLWMTVTEMGKPGRKLMIHSGSGLLTMYGDNEPELRETEHRQGVLIRLTIPA